MLSKKVEFLNKLSKNCKILLTLNDINDLIGSQVFNELVGCIILVLLFAPKFICCIELVAKFFNYRLMSNEIKKCWYNLMLIDFIRRCHF